MGKQTFQAEGPAGKGLAAKPRGNLREAVQEARGGVSCRGASDGAVKLSLSVIWTVCPDPRIG